MKLDNATTIIDEDKFIKSHQKRLRSGGVPRVTQPFTERLTGYAKKKRVHLCSGCFELLGDEVWKCPVCGVNSQGSHS